MSEETLYEGLKQEIRGLKDPGNVLILVYISLVLFLLLFAGLESARADFGTSSAGAFARERTGDLSASAGGPSYHNGHFQVVDTGLFKK